MQVLDMPVPQDIADAPLEELGLVQSSALSWPPTVGMHFLIARVRRLREGGRRQRTLYTHYGEWREVMFHRGVASRSSAWPSLGFLRARPPMRRRTWRPTSSLQACRKKPCVLRRPSEVWAVVPVAFVEREDARDRSEDGVVLLQGLPSVAQ